MYHPYCQSPSALTEYLKHKLRAQRAKRLGRSLPAQVEPNVQPERNIVSPNNKYNTTPIFYGLALIHAKGWVLDKSSGTTANHVHSCYQPTYL